MKLILDHQEIDQALIDYVRKQGLNVNAGDIEIKVQDGVISAALAANFFDAVVQSTAASVAVSSSSQTPVTKDIPAEPDQDIEPDREELKTKLDKLGIEYAPKARTATLQTLWDEAQTEQKNQPEFPFDVPPKKVPSEEDTSGLFEQSAADTVSSEEAPVFTTDGESNQQEEPDDDVPLFRV